MIAAVIVAGAAAVGIAAEIEGSTTNNKCKKRTILTSSVFLLYF
jgi:hypothetical protein